MAGTAVRGRLTWQTTTVSSVKAETASVRTILRYRIMVGSSVPVRLLYSSRSWADVIYRDELSRPAPGVEVIHTLTRSHPDGWTGYTRRVDAAMLAEVAFRAAEGALAYVCGPTNFVEAVAAGLVGLGYPAGRVKTERFGATGQ